MDVITANNAWEEQLQTFRNVVLMQCRIPAVDFFTSSSTNLFSLSERFEFEFQAGQFSIVLLKHEGLVWLENLVNKLYKIQISICLTTE